MAILSVNETTTYRWSLEEDLAEYAAAGIGALGVWRQKLSDCGPDRGIELIRRSGLRVSHLLWAGGFTGGDGRTYRESLDDAREALQTAAALESGCLVVYSGSRAGHTYNHARRLIHGALVELAPQAAELGVTLAVEPMHEGCAGGMSFLTSLDETLALLEAVGSPGVKMVFDTYHLGHDPAIIDRAAAIVPRLAIVELGDARRPPDGEQSRCRLGEGCLRLGEIVAALKSAGYDGCYSVELLGEEVEACDYRELLRHAKAAFDQLVGA